MQLVQVLPGRSRIGASINFRGKPVTVYCFVDTDHPHRSYTGVLLFLSRASIMWYFNKREHHHGVFDVWLGVHHHT
jgi:hypothetical protein